MGRGMVVYALLVSLLVIMGIRGNVRAFLTDVKLHLASRTQAALYALRSGLASIDACEF